MKKRHQNKEDSKSMIARLIKMIDPLLIVFAFYITWRLYYSHLTAVIYWWRGELAIMGIYLFVYVYLSHLYHGYWIHINRISEVIYSQALAAIVSLFLIYMVLVLLCKRVPNILPLFAMLVVQGIIISLWAVLAHKWYYHSHPKRKTVIVWDERPGIEDRILEYGMDKQFEIIGIHNVLECMKDMDGILQGADAVFMCDLHSHERNQMVKYCVENGVTAYVIPRIGDTIMSGASNTHLMHLPILMVRRTPAKWEYLLLKRLFDIVVSFIGIIILSPIIIIATVAIKLGDGGSVFYRQERLTRDGEVFNIIKFRSMKMDAESDGVPVLSTGDDDGRVTSVGRIMRRLRIDEIPQLINVVKGEMSIVGPRPERPEIATEYEKELPSFSLRLQMKAGITGYAQVYGQYNTSPYDKLLMDLTYISRASISEDFRIILATIKILFMAESTEGVHE